MFGLKQTMEEMLKKLKHFDSQFLEEIEAAYLDCISLTNISSWFSRLDQLARARE